ncbi:MAG TPA: hypothetical protein VGF25_18480 [Thermoleophilaceae bacterium]
MSAVPYVVGAYAGVACLFVLWGSIMMRHARRRRRELDRLEQR